MAFNWAAAAGAAQGASGIIAPIIGAASASKRDHDQRNFLRGAYDLEKADALAQWNRENEYGEYAWHKMNAYNSPMAQMERFKEAGLNPNLIYGNMSSSPSFAMGRYDSPKTGGYNASREDYSGVANGLAGGLSAYIGFREAAARTDNLQAQNEVLKQEAVIKAFTAAGLSMDNVIKSESVPYAKQNAANAARLADANVMSSLQANENLVQQFVLNERRDSRETESNRAYLRESDRRVMGMDQERVMKQLEINLRQIGINPNDPTVLRIIGQLFNETVEKTKKYFTR